MKEETKVLFLRPFLFQENITAVVLVPIVVFFFLGCSEGIRNNLILVALCASAAATVGLLLGLPVKYCLIRPAIELMGKDRYKPEEVLHAVRLTSILPLAESIVIFIRWSISAILICVVPLYSMGIATSKEAIFATYTLTMVALSVMPFFYLASENSLVPFYMRCNLEGILDGKMRLFRLSLNQKLLATVLLITIPPIGIILGTICLSISTGLKLESIQFGFLLILVQTTIMIFINAGLLMKSLSLSVGKMSLMLEDMAMGEGDLTRRLNVTGLHEVGKLAFWFNRFMDDIEQIISHVRETSMQLYKVTEEVSAGSHDLSQSTQEQAASVEEISASIDEMNGTVQHNAELINEGKDTSQTIKTHVDRSREVFSKLRIAIEEISKDSKKIGDIVTRVNEVSFQTNLLALNAAVEAARAGENGKGFAVVASEVRALAQRSAESVNEIRGLIEGTVTRIITGDEMMGKTSESLEEMMSKLEFFFGLMEVISTSSTEQAQNIGELNHAISQIDNSTQHNSTTVEQLVQTLDNLRTMSTVLAEDVQKFKTSRREYTTGF